MHDVHIRKDELLSILTKNREAHRNVFLEAQKGYKQQVIDLLETYLKQAREGRNFQLSIFLEAPKDQTKDYDRVIKMLEMHQAELVVLSERDFAQYVQDDWQWKRDFLHKNAVYSVSAARQLETMGEE